MSRVRYSLFKTLEVELMIANGTFIQNRINIGKSEETVEGVIKACTLHNAAHTISHLNAIKQAYVNGLETVLIIENNAVLTKSFLENWKAYADLAPLDWKILQWTTNPAVNTSKAYLKK